MKLVDNSNNNNNNNNEFLINRFTVRKEQSSHNHKFFGQISSIYCFEEPLSPTQIQAIYSLGANYLGSFQPENSTVTRNRNTTGGSSGGNNSTPSTNILDGSLTKLLLFTYNPKVR